MSKPFKFALVACSASKLDRPAQARELYTGDLFKLAMQYAALVADETLILSAKHGVVHPSLVLEPYELAVSSLEKHQREQWGANVARELQKRFGVRDQSNMKHCRELGAGVLCLASASYVEAIGFMYGLDAWTYPLKGLGIGDQKKRLKQLLADAQPPRTLAELVLQLDTTFAGDPDSPFEMPGAMWQRLVEQARKETAR